MNPRPIHRRQILAGLGAVISVVAWETIGARSAFAGSYLDRSILLLDEAKKDRTTLREHMLDKELAHMIEAVADARVKAASKMEVPPSVVRAHPHLLLTMIHTERAADAACDGNIQAVAEHLEEATHNEEMFRSLIGELGFKLKVAG